MKLSIGALVLLAAGFALPAAAAEGDLDFSFGGGILHAPVTTHFNFPAISAVRSDGKITLCSVGFPSYSLYLSRFEASGGLDPSFGDGGVVDTGSVLGGGPQPQLAMAAKLDSLTVIAAYNPSSSNLFLQQYDPSGALDLDFGYNGAVLVDVPTAVEAGFDLEVYYQGWLLLAGIDTARHEPFVVRITANGGVDTSFGDGGFAYPGFGAGNDDDVSVEISVDGIFLASRDGATGRPYVARFDWLGNLVPEFGDGGIAFVDVFCGYQTPIDLKIDSTSHVYLAGDDASSSEYFLARFGIWGGLDVGFGDAGIVHTGMGSHMYGSMALGTQAGGEAIVASMESGTSNFYMCRFDTQGLPDAEFGQAGVARLGIDNPEPQVAMTVCPDDKILLASQDMGVEAAFVARFTEDGQLDRAGLLPGRAYSGLDSESSKVSMALLPGGGELLAGITAEGTYYLQRFDFAGLRDPDFWLGGNRVLQELNTDPQSPVDLAVVPGTTDFCLLGHNGLPESMGQLFVQRFHGDGSEDLSFGGGLPVFIDMSVEFEHDASIVALPDGRVRLAGSKWSLGEHFLVGLLPNGDVDESFGDNGYVITNVHSGYANGMELALLDTGELVLAGMDIEAGQTFLMRFESNGAPDLDFGTGGVARSGISFNSSQADVGFAVSDSGPMLSGVNQDEQYYVARFTWDGVLDPTYGVGGIAFPGVYTFDYLPHAIAVQADGKVVLTGVKRSNRYHFFVRLGTDGSRDTEFGLYGIKTTYVRSAIHAGVCIDIQEDGKILGASYDADQGQDYLIRLIATSGSVVAVNEDSAPSAMLLNQNYPNPFNPGTTISFALPQTARANLAVFDVSGGLVRTLVAGATLQPGRHEVVWQGDDDFGRTVAAGIYFYRLETREYSETKRMVLIK